MAPVLLSYAELGERLQIKAESARKLAQRKRWHKVTANDGTTRIQVPEEELPAQDNDQGERATAALVYTRELETRIEGLNALVDTWKEQANAWHNQAVAADARASAADARADTAEAKASAAQTRADAAEARAQRPWWKRLAG